jgi:hypothetical protein
MKNIGMISLFAGMQIVLAVTAAHAGRPPIEVPEPGTSSAAVAVYVWWRNRK